MFPGGCTDMQSQPRPPAPQCLSSGLHKAAPLNPSPPLHAPLQFFGFSGFGQFSKENELFVGRVAQLGFASGEHKGWCLRAGVDQHSKQCGTLEPIWFN